MPARSEITYFGAGPAPLPTDVLETAAQALVDYEGTGLGLAEHSHRSAHAERIIAQTKADLAAFLDIATDDYDILFLQGGGTGEFAATVYHAVGCWVARELVARGGDEADENVVAALRARVAGTDGQGPGLVLDYVVTGSWSLKAYQEAQRLLGSEHVNLVADARVDNRFGAIPDPSTWKLTEGAAMVYYCDNETVDGVEFPEFPAVLAASDAFVVADMSSNILSRRFPVPNYSILFFGAQKNLGTTGITVAVVKKALLPPRTTQPSADLMRRLGLPVAPIVFSYDTVAKNNSLYNTLSIFDVYVAGLVLSKLLTTFPDKVDGQQALAEKKSRLMYAALDAHPDVYRVVPETSARSRMNICFRVVKNGDVDGGSETRFLKAAEALGLMGLKGHRSVGGIRASNYNAVPLEGAERLARFMHDFAAS